MAKTGHYIQSSVEKVNTNVGNAFSTAIPVELADRRLVHSAVFVFVDTIAAGAANITFRVTSDASGDVTIIPDTSAAIVVGITTATVGSVVYKVDIAIPVEDSTVYVWLKTDAGTCKAREITLSAWE